MRYLDQVLAPGCWTAAPGEDVRDPNRMTARPPLLSRAMHAHGNVTVPLAQLYDSARPPSGCRARRATAGLRAAPGSPKSPVHLGLPYPRRGTTIAPVRVYGELHGARAAEAACRPGSRGTGSQSHHHLLCSCAGSPRSSRRRAARASPRLDERDRLYRIEHMRQRGLPPALPVRTMTNGCAAEHSPLARAVTVAGARSRVVGRRPLEVVEPFFKKRRAHGCSAVVDEAAGAGANRGRRRAVACARMPRRR